MDLEKLKRNINSARVVEELIMLSQKVFGKSSDETKDIIDTFITRAYLMWKQNKTKTLDDL